MKGICFKISFLVFVLASVFYNAQSNDYTGLVKKWNDAHNNWKFNDLEKLYSENVLFYGSNTPRKQCISYKTNLASPTQVYMQSILSGIESNDLGNGLIKCSFTKEVIIGDKKTEYPAYLVIKELNDTLKIVCESDEITDATFGFKLSAELFEPIKPGSPAPLPQSEEKDPSYLAGYIAGFVLVLGLAGYLLFRRSKKNKDT